MLIPSPITAQEAEYLIKKGIRDFIEEFEKNLKKRSEEVFSDTHYKPTVGLVEQLVLEALKETKKKL